MNSAASRMERSTFCAPSGLLSTRYRYISSMSLCARLLEPFAHGRAFFIGHHIGARATCLDFTRDLHKLVLILLGPGLDFFEKVSRGRSHDAHLSDCRCARQYSTAERPRYCRTSSSGWRPCGMRCQVPLSSSSNRHGSLRSDSTSSNPRSMRQDFGAKLVTRLSQPGFTFMSKLSVSWAASSRLIWHI